MLPHMVRESWAPGAGELTATLAHIIDAPMKNGTSWVPFVLCAVIIWLSLQNILNLGYQVRHIVRHFNFV
jgi:ABC-type microcin C transport system permease subunit YejE